MRLGRAACSRVVATAKSFGACISSGSFLQNIFYRTYPIVYKARCARFSGGKTPANLVPAFIPASFLPFDPARPKRVSPANAHGTARPCAWIIIPSCAPGQWYCREKWPGYSGNALSCLRHRLGKIDVPGIRPAAVVFSFQQQSNRCD